MTFPRPVLGRLHKTSGGNPFYALELARALERRGGSADLGSELPVPRSLRALVEERLAALPEETRKLLVHAAALAQPSVALLEAALDRDAEAHLGPAVEAQVVELDDKRVAFTHPLLASVLLSALSAPERRRVHSRLAEVVRDPEARARHLALATDRPDVAVADALERAATLALSRGAPDAAAELLEQARRLTTPGRAEDRRRRIVRAAEFHLEAGATTRAEELLEEAVATSPSGPLRAEALLRLAWVREHKDGMAMVDLLTEALHEAKGEAPYRSEIEDALAWAKHMSGDLEAAARHALLCCPTSPRTLVTRRSSREALANVALLEFLLGRGVDRALLDRALALEAESVSLRIIGQPSWLLAMLQVWTGELDAARTNVERAAPPRHGDGRRERHTVHSQSSEPARLGRGRLDRVPIASSTRRSPRRSETPRSQSALSRWPRRRSSLRIEDASMPPERSSRKGLRSPPRPDILPAEFELRAISGFLELSVGDFEAAEAELGPLRRDLAAAGFGEPAVIAFRFHQNEIEALVGLGRLDEAAELVEELEERGRRLDRPWALAMAGRGRALLCNARGDLQGALAAADEAVHTHARLAEPFELARTLLALGIVQRRLRRNRAARETLQSAFDRFEALGAPLWADRARAELARIGGHVGSPGTLTPAEGRIAALVAQGRSNKEVASELYISVHTVEAALTRAYSKLGVRSRTQLARELASRGDGGKM